MSMPTCTAESETAIKKLAARDHRAAHTLMVRSYLPGLVYYVASIVRNFEEAHDLAVDTFVRALSETRIFDSEFRIRAWLYRVAFNLSVNSLRDRQRRVKLLEWYRHRLVPPPPIQAEQHVSAEQVAAHLELLLQQLSPKHEQILRLRHFEGLSYQEISIRTQMPLGTVMSRLSRAHAQLRDLIESQNLEQELIPLH